MWATIYPIIDQVSSTASIPLALIGFIATFVQARSAKRAAREATAVAKAVKADLRRNDLLGLLPQLYRTEDDLQRAMRGDSVDLVSSYLTIWRWQAGQVREHLTRESPADRKLMRLLQASISSAATMKGELHRTSIDDLSDAVEPTLKAMLAVTGELGSLSANRAATTGEVAAG